MISLLRCFTIVRKVGLRIMQKAIYTVAKMMAAIGVMAVLSACSSTPQNGALSKAPANSKYCDSYLMYEMCADD